MNASIKRSVFGILILFLIGCGGKPPVDNQLLATFGQNKIFLKDLDQFLLGHSQDNRWAPQGDETQVWMEDKIRRLAVERILSQKEAMATLLAEPETKARELMSRFQQLNAALTQELGKELLPPEDAINARIKQILASVPSEPIHDLQHIFIRTDKGDAVVKKQTAQDVWQRAKAGEDFTQLVRQYSASQGAKEDGFIRNIYLSNLDKKVANALQGLEEGAISSLIESRTGLHIFRLVRRIEQPKPSEEKLKTRAIATIQRENFPAHRQALLKDLRMRIPVDADQETWQIGSFAIEKDIRLALLDLLGGRNQQTENALIEQGLLAHEALERQLAPPNLDAQLKRMTELGVLQTLFNEYFKDLATLLPAEKIQSFYNAQPSLFATPEELRVSLIFVPKGKDSFETQKKLEQDVETLKKGASFSDMAKKMSTGPNASSGGDLGFMSLQSFQKYGPNVANALTQMKEGDISNPIYCTDRILSQNGNLLRGGFAILKLEARKPAQDRSFEQAIDDVRTIYLAQNRAEIDKEVRDRILQEAGFELVRVPATKELIK